MKDKKLYIAYASILGVTLIAFAVSATLALYSKDTKSNGSYGEISLRSYFERGNGKKPYDASDPNSSPEDYPFVITRPRHLYNLSRLQGLGVFDNKTYFQLGYDWPDDGVSGPQCYANDSSDVRVSYLNMVDSNYSYEPINAIGSEVAPFYGEFNGNDLEIRNLSVYADPQDAGLFGYTAHDSNVHNLFLNNVTINTLGYSNEYSDLYGNNAAVMTTNTKFIYNQGRTDAHNFILGDDTYRDGEFDAEAYWGPSQTVPDETVAPTLTFTGEVGDYNYRIYRSGGFLVEDGSKGVKINIKSVFDYMALRKKDSTQTYPITASSTASLCATDIDNHGVEHSKVVLSLRFSFTLESAEDTIVRMSVHLAQDHSNNIGLLIGHCDGSVSDCYVYNGKFIMNNGNSITGTSSYQGLDNHSATGLIGLVGDTVNNLAVLESSAASTDGKSIGVLDFTNIYDDIVDPSRTFASSTLVEPGKPVFGISYVPKSTSKYRPFLRKKNGVFVTYVDPNAASPSADPHSISLRGQQVIKNTDLGVFTLATDYETTGYDSQVSYNLEKSRIKSENVAYTESGQPDSYYVYYAMGEFAKGSWEKKDRYAYAFTEYTNAMQSTTPTQVLMGQHLPHPDQVTVESFAQRERYQNYFFRFKLDNMHTKRLYFSDLDVEKPGGSFLSKYFQYKLVDKRGNPYAESAPECGIMMRDYRGGKPTEITSFSASFSAPDLATNGRMYCLYNPSESHPAANTINFEIKTDWANVTVVAAPETYGKSAALGVYKYKYNPGGEDHTYSGTFASSYGVGETPPYLYITRNYQDPDYAFFMPKDNNIAYYDYVVDQETVDGKTVNVGHVGTYSHSNNTWSFNEAEVTDSISTEATMPIKVQGSESEYGYNKGSNKSRLFAHTFKLPKGRYYLSSATGAKDNPSNTFCRAKIFYVCAQGQTEGQLDLADTANYSDQIERVDFINRPRANISDLSDYATWRCYVSLLLSKTERSHFLETPAPSNLSFDYLTDHFAVQSTTMGAMDYVIVNTFKNDTLDALNTPVKLFNLPLTTASQDLVYHRASSG